MSDAGSYLVRGAVLYCDQGSHFRKLDLPAAHGSFVRQKPILTAADTKPNDNIPCFGICSAENNPSNDIVEISSVTDAIPISDSRGNPKPPPSPITGKLCTPNPVAEWDNPAPKTIIGQSAALTTQSILVCQCGGHIMPVKDGQEVARKG